MESSIQTEKELEFAIFCIKNIAIHLNVPDENVYEVLAVKSNLLNSYIIPCFDIPHTQGKDYIIETIEERGMIDEFENIYH